MDRMSKDIETRLRDAAATIEAPAPGAIAERAAAEGLLDIAYATVDSPVGSLVAATTPRGLVRLAYGAEDEVLDDLATRLSPRILEAPARLDRVRRELDEYFEGERKRFDLPIDWSLTRGFAGEVLRQTARIDFGKTSTYAELASRAGSPRAVRAAGNALGANPIPVVVPCHRVLRTGGALGGYTGGIERKQFLLRLEGALA
jgi:methylated-DNA-[protein]-cysteine S-methyltransferase